ncbi:cytidine deoxycytidylate deaminase [Colletotrichum truncatum]|uniref:Cytidine deoxycytidylate deaminase n=1 Tax=Colletotrichum truncatum TaxID=5467 RepID=A0ACC3YYB0_COLTU|nr:cytidine deoxycytidylate deaminase [Colletotrichum truncatum]KAF6790771.1 cytidine deoxycytidylate deaminase [Colletotrichum truncatum]
MSQTPDIKILKRCVELAREALEAGDDPFGSVLVSGDGTVIREDRNRTKTGDNGNGQPDATLHPEFTLARWAQLNLSNEERAKASVYTSGEHCAMCAAAHAWVGLGPIVYVSSTEQYGSWLKEFGLEPGTKVAPLPISQVAPNIPIQGPIPGLAEEVKELHKKKHEKSS